MAKDVIAVAQEALLAGATHVLNLFGKSMEEIGVEYKPEAGDTPRTLIDKHAQTTILDVIQRRPEFARDTFNPEESEQFGSGNREWHIDPYDGTSNAQIKLPMSTMGIGIRENGQLVASIICNPFERKIFYAEKGKGAYRKDLDLNLSGELYPLHIENIDQKLATDAHTKKAHIKYAWIDTLFNAKTTPRKLEWIARMQEAGLFQNVRMTGSNVDYSAKLAEGRGHYQLTDAVGGFYDLCGYNLIEEAGGRMVNVQGEEPKPDDHVAIAVANSRDLETVLRITEKCYQGYEGFK